MLEASNELRVVKNELENLMEIISTKVNYNNASHPVTRGKWHNI